MRQHCTTPGVLLVAVALALGSITAPAAGTDQVGEAGELADLGTRKQGVDWPRFLGPTGNNTSPEKGIITQWGAMGPRIVWHRKLGISYGISTIYKGRLFQFDRQGDQARLDCLHAETGKPLWKFEYPTDYEDLYGYNAGPRCSPIVDGNRVYIFGAEGKLHCVHAGTGRLLWKVDTRERFGVVQNFFGVGSNPVVEGDLLLVMVGGSPPEDQDVPPGRLNLVGGNGTGIVAFDKRTGQVKYTITDELAGYASLQLASIAGRRWCFAFARSGLVGFEPNSGRVDFHYPWRARMLESVNASTPVVVNNQVLISETYGPGSALLEVSPGKAQVVWRDDPNKRDKSLQTHWNTPIYHQGYVYGCSGRHTYNAELRCVQWQTGKVMWSEPNLTRTSLLYVDQHLICLGEDGVLRLLKVNPRKYEELAAVVLRDPTAQRDGVFQRLPLLQYPCWAAPILSHGLLYVRGKDHLVCLELIPET